jgi:glycerophosphoryl diester phosphodiesterase
MAPRIASGPAWAAVATRLPALRRPPILFAHRGARAHAPENTIEAFALARRLGATGLESDVWLTADGVPVLDHDGRVGRRPRRQPIDSVPQADLPGHIPTLGDLFDAVGTDFELSLDVKDPAAADATVTAAHDADPTLVSRLWLCHRDVDVLGAWRSRWPDVRLVASIRLRQLTVGSERFAADLQRQGIDAVNLHYSEWTGGLAALFHRFGILAFGWDAQFERLVATLLDAGLDAVYSDHVDRLVETAARYYPPA